MRSAVLGLVVAFALAGAASAAPTTADQAWRELHELADKAEKMPVKTVDARLQAIISSPVFDQLPDNIRCGAFILAGAAKLELGDAAAANLLLAKATAFPNAPKETWHLRLQAALGAADPASAVDSLQAMAQHWPSEIANFKDETVIDVINEARRLSDGKARQLALLDALNDGGWSPTDPGENVDHLWKALALGLAEQGHTARAATIAQRITSPWVLADMRADARFDPLYDHKDSRYDPETAMIAELARRRQLMVDHPERLNYANLYAEDLILTHHPAEALKLLDDAIARARAAPVGGKAPTAYSDQAEQYVWALDYRSRALFQLGRFDEVLALRRLAADQLERGHANVSQVLNLAGLYDDLARPQEALDTLKRVPSGGMSPYGQLVYQSARGRACAQLADKACIEAATQVMREHEDDAPGTLISMLVSIDDVDAAAAVYIRRLADPDKRGPALNELQDFADSLTETPTEQLRHKRYAVLVNRPDLLAAVAKVGRIYSYSFMQRNG